MLERHRFGSNLCIGGQQACVVLLEASHLLPAQELAFPGPKSQRLLVAFGLFELFWLQSSTYCGALSQGVLLAAVPIHGFCFTTIRSPATSMIWTKGFRWTKFQFLMKKTQAAWERLDLLWKKTLLQWRGLLSLRWWHGGTTSWAISKTTTSLVSVTLGRGGFLCRVVV